MSRVLEILTRKGWIVPFLVFVVVALAIAVPRLGTPYTWCDTGHMIATSETALASMDNPTEAVLSHTRAVWYDDVSIDRYIPLTSIQVVALTALLPDNPLIPTIYQGVIWGLLAMMIYLLTVALTGRRLMGLGAGLLLSLSVPAIQMGWILLQTTALVELIIVSGLYFYICYRKSGGYLWLCLLGACCIIGPLVRELAVIIPLVVFLTVVVERRWDRKLGILLPVFLIHGLCPSLFPNLLLGRLVVLPIFTRGIPKIYFFLGTGGGDSGIRLSLDMPAHLALYVQPSLILLAVASIVVFLNIKTRVQGRVGRFAGLFLTIVLILSFASLFFTNLTRESAGTSMSIAVLPTFLCLLVAAASFSFLTYGKLLSVWFMVAWAPFFQMYNSVDAGLMAPAIPWVIMITIWICLLPEGARRLWRTLSARSKRLLLRPLIVGIFVLLLVVGLGGQAFNLVAVHRTFDGYVSVTDEMVGWLTTSIPEGSIVITNLIRGAELEFLADGKFEHYYAFYMPAFPPNIPDAASYDRLVRENFPTRDIYILVDSARAKNEWLLYQPDKTLVLETEFSMSRSYPVLDPLRACLPGNYRIHAGPPDLVTEIRTRTGLFFQESFADYSLYKLVGYSPEVR